MIDIIEKLHTWTSGKMLARFNEKHSLCECPYCMQYAETGQEQYEAWDSWSQDNDYLVLTCGPCGGTSLWIETMHMFIDLQYVCPLTPPVGKKTLNADYIPPDLKKKLALDALAR